MTSIRADVRALPRAQLGKDQPAHASQGQAPEIHVGSGLAPNSNIPLGVLDSPVVSDPYELAALGVWRAPNKMEESQLFQQLPPQLQTMCATLKNDTPKVALGHGAMNSVYLVAVELPDSSVFEGVCKLEHDQWCAGLERVGISRDRQTLSVRNLAAWKLDQRLGLGVIPCTHLVIQKDEDSVYELGCIMERAVGVSPLNTGNKEVVVTADVASVLEARPELLRLFALSHGFKSAEVKGSMITLEGPRHKAEVAQYRNTLDLQDSELRRELTKLQWLDSLTGQIDRHPENYFIGRDARDRLRVTGIDNDMAFGKTVRFEGELLYSAAELPQVIDRQTATALLTLDPDHLDEDCLGLSRDEIGAAKDRLQIIKTALNSGDVLIAENWSSAQVTDRLGVMPCKGQPDWSRGDAGRFVAEAQKTSYVAYISAIQELAERTDYYTPAMPSYAPGELEKFAEGIQKRAHLA